jgi:GT2 family glycosyltransferase
VRDERVALVVLTHERRERVCRSLVRALALPEAPELIVVDNGSCDGTAAAVERVAPEACVIRSPLNLGAAGRNLGVAATSRPYVAFSDDDTWWEPGALSRAADRLDAAPALAVVSAQVRVAPGGRLDPACRAMAESPLGRRADGGMRLVGFLAGACVARRSAFLAAGGYDARLFLGAEESLLALDLLARGFEIAYFADVVAHHAPAPRDAARRRARLLANEIQVAWLRRPLPSALAITRRRLAEANREGALAAVAAGCLRACARLARERRVVSPALEQALRRVETLALR